MPCVAGAVSCSCDLLLHHPLSPVSAFTPVSPAGPGHCPGQWHVPISGFPVRLHLTVISLSLKRDRHILGRQHGLFQTDNIDLDNLFKDRIAMCPFPGLYNSPLNYSYYIQPSKICCISGKKATLLPLTANFGKQLSESTTATAFECQNHVYCLDPSLLQWSEFCKVWNCSERLICGYHCLTAGRDVEHESAKLLVEVALQCAAFLCYVNL